MESVVTDKLEAFAKKIEDCKRFEIVGTDKDDSVFVLSDTTKSDGIYGKYIEVSVEEVISRPISQIFAVINNERNPIVMHGISRIVGYYSRMHNWHRGKVEELKDRIQGRTHGGYGFNGLEGDNEAINEALAVTSGLSKL